MDRILATKRSHSMLNVVNTGAVLFGLLDIDTRSQVTILGSPVNLQADLKLSQRKIK
jgi:hypothetical protein